MSVLGAMRWSYSADMMGRIAQPLTYAVLARLLIPADFGVSASAVMVVSFAQIFWEAGMAKALIQRQVRVADAANVAFFTNVVLGVVVALLLVILAPWVALTIFSDPRVGPVLRVMSLYVVLGALSSVQFALLQKEMDYRRLFRIRLVVVFLPPLLSIPLALIGWGYWSLVVGALAGQAAQSSAIWWMSGWRPTWSYDRDLANQMLRFGGWAAFAGVLGWFYVWADSIVVGANLGATDLGLYRTGSQFATMIFAAIVGSTVPVLYSHLSGMGAERVTIAPVVALTLRALTLICIPIGFVLFAFAVPLSSLVFGSAWTGVGGVLAVLSLAQGYSWVVGMNGEIYRAMGKPKFETVVPIALLPVYGVVYLTAIRLGLPTFVWARLGLALFSCAVHLWLVCHLLQLRFHKTVAMLVGVSALALGVVAGIRGFIAVTASTHVAVMLVGALLSSMIIFGLLAWIERDRFVRDVLARMPLSAAAGSLRSRLPFSKENRSDP